jgi:hypothetical protein
MILLAHALVGPLRRAWRMFLSAGCDARSAASEPASTSPDHALRIGRTEKRDRA